MSASAKAASEAEQKHTPGPYHWRRYANEPEDVERARKLGIEPVRMLTNEGQIALMAGIGYGVKRIALIDCQTYFKRGQGHKTECTERDANANLLAAADALYAAILNSDDAHWTPAMRAAMAKAEGR